MRRSHFALVFLVIVVIGFGIAYLERGKIVTASSEDCAAYCKPKKGVLERHGANVGPDWRPTSHNVICTCK